MYHIKIFFTFIYIKAKVSEFLDLPIHQAVKFSNSKRPMKGMH